GHAHLHVLREEGGVVEDRADLVRVAVLVGTGRDQDERHRGGAHAEDDEQASPGPGGTSFGPQAPASSPSARNGWASGVGQRALGWEAPPGQRVNGPSPSGG